MTPAENELQIVVAAWGPAFGHPVAPVFVGEQFADQGPELAYELRRKVTIDASPGMGLGELIDQAATEFGVFSRTERAISEQVPCVAFFQGGDQGGMAGGPTRWNRAIRTVGADRSPPWPVRWSEIRLEELVDTSAAGLIDGDPLRPYFWPVIPQGGLTDVASSILVT